MGPREMHRGLATCSLVTATAKTFNRSDTALAGEEVSFREAVILIFPPLRRGQT
jgi:hypothetical protein